MTTRQAWCAKCDEAVPCDERGCIACRVEREEKAKALQSRGPVVLAPFCAICITGKTGLHGVQLDKNGPVFTLCMTCDGEPAVEIPRVQTQRYMPVDETLSMMRTRILRALRRFDWATSEQLALAMNLEEYSPEHDQGRRYHSKERKRYQDEMSNLVKDGLVARDDSDRIRYRITSAGRETYTKDIERNQACARIA